MLSFSKLSFDFKVFADIIDLIRNRMLLFFFFFLFFLFLFCFFNNIVQHFNFNLMSLE